jgi:hypothetical protein
MQIGFVRLRTVEEAKRAIQGMNGYREEEGCTPWCVKVFSILIISHSDYIRFKRSFQSCVLRALYFSPHFSSLLNLRRRRRSVCEERS